MNETHHVAGHTGSGSGSDPGDDHRTVMVFLRDLERDLGTGYKTTGVWREGRFDPTPWSEGENRCDCRRGSILYMSGTFPCGTSRFVVERIVVWDTGETVYSERGYT